MSYNESVLKELLDLIPQTGRLEWIGIRPGKKQALTELKSVRMEQNSGLEGDRFRGSVSGKRQVILIQHEHLQVVPTSSANQKSIPDGSGATWSFPESTSFPSNISLFKSARQYCRPPASVLPAAGWRKTSDPGATTRCAAMEESLRKSSNPVKSRSVTRCGSYFKG